MIPEKTTAEKVLAIFVVIFLFLFIGTILFFISLNNKEKTAILRDKVRQLQAEKAEKAELEKIYFATSSEPIITSTSFLTIAITDNGTEKILAEKNPNLPLPIASVTKLMVAVITLENLNPETQVTATLDYIGKEESAYVLEVNKIYKVKELLVNTLVSSDNDSARLLSSTLEESNFIIKMNQKAEDLGLTRTNFVNPTGLDPVDPGNGINTSTANDLARLLIYIKKNHLEILKTTTATQYNFCDINNYCKNIINTDKLLENTDFPFKIIGSKTGNTDLAGRNLVLITKVVDGISLINIVLGSKDNFTDTSALINNIRITN